jgi:hypothetical protein
MSGAFEFKSLADLYSQPDDGCESLLDGLLQKGGFSILAAKPKVGKSTLARNLVLAIARGDQAFLGREIKISGPAVYLGLEEKTSEVRAHFQRMGASPDLPIYIHTGSALMVSAGQAIIDLDKVIGEKKAVLAVVDTLQRLLRLKDLNKYGEVSLTLEPLVKVARDSGCHIMLVHHTKKGPDDDILDSVSGSTAIGGACDTLIAMKKAGVNRTVESRQRYGKDLPCTVLAFDEKTGLITPGGTLDEFQLQERCKAILALLGDHDLMAAEIKAALTNYNSGSIHESLEHLVTEGKIERVGSGIKGDPYRYRMSKGDVSVEAANAEIANIMSGTIPDWPLSTNSVDKN